jgi:hypothetical protein
VKVQADKIISLTNEAIDLRVRLQNANRVVEAQMQTLEQAQQAEPSPVVPLVIGAGVLLGVFVMVTVVLQRRPRQGLPFEEPQPYQAAGDVIDNEGNVAL